MEKDPAQPFRSMAGSREQGAFRDETIGSFAFYRLPTVVYKNSRQANLSGPEMHDLVRLSCKMKYIHFTEYSISLNQRKS